MALITESLYPISEATVITDGELTDNFLLRGNGGAAIDITNIFSSADGNDLTIPGDLTVNGTTVTLDAETLLIEDKNIELGVVTTPTDATANGGGWTLKGATDKIVAWNSTTSRWDYNQGIEITSGDLVVSENVAIGLISASEKLHVLDGTVTFAAKDGQIRVAYSATKFVNLQAESTGSFNIFLPGFTNTPGMRLLQESLIGTDDLLFQGNPNSTSAYTIMSDFGGAGLAFDARGAGANNILFRTAPATSSTGVEHMRLTSGGLLGLGISSSIAAKLHILDTTEQLRLAFDSSNYVSHTVSSSGALTWAVTGTSTAIDTLTLSQSSTFQGDLPVVLLTAAGATSDVNFAIEAGGSGGVLFLGAGSSSNDVEIGRGGILKMDGANDGIIVGRSITTLVSSNGRVAEFRALAGTHTKTQIKITSPDDDADALFLGANDFGVDSGSGFIVMATSTQLFFSTATGEAMRFTGLNATFKGSLNISNAFTDLVPMSTWTNSGANGGTTSAFLGSRNPNGNVTGAGGALHIHDGGALSRLRFNLSATTGTVWQDVSLNAPTTVELHSAADYDNLAVSNIITTTGVRLLINKATVISAGRHVVTSGGKLVVTEPGDGNSQIYTGSSPYITATVNADIEISKINLIAGISGTKLFNNESGTGLGTGDTIALTDTVLLFGGWDLGTINVPSTRENGVLFAMTTVAIIDITAGLVVDAPSSMRIDGCLIDQTDSTGSGESVFTINNTIYKEGGVVMINNTGTLYSGESLLKLNAGLPNDFIVDISGNTLELDGTATVFDTSGSTGAFTVVANNSISATAITSVTDSSGVASFVHAGTSPLLGSQVTVSGFTTNTVYNTTGIVTARTATTFEIAYVAFGTTETGSYAVTGVTVTATAHGLTLGTGVTLDTTLSVAYDGGFLIYNIQTNSFDVPATFIATQAGTWSTEGLDETDVRVLSRSNANVPDSRVLAFGGSNSNITTTTAITSNTYVPIIIKDIVQNDVTERIKLTTAGNGIWTLTALEDVKGFINFFIWAIKAGSTEIYRFTVGVNAVVPTFATAEFAKMEVKTTTIQTVCKLPVDWSKGDTRQIYVAGENTTDVLTITDIFMSIEEG